MNKGFRKVLIAAAIATAFGAQGAMAATDGTLGATSTGTSLVSLSISQLYRISGMTDFAFGAYSGTGALTANHDVCVYTNDATRAYHVVVTDNSGMSATNFSVQNAGATADIAYAVKWNSGTGITGNAAVTYNTALAGTNANILSSDCTTGGNSANLEVDFAAAALQAAPAGSYSATLSVLVEP
jgi:hypothetical protein